MKFIRKWKVSLPIAGVLLAGLAWLAFGFFGIHTAFIDDKVDEAAPVFDAAPAADTEVIDDADGTADGETAAATGTDDDAATDVPAAGEPDADAADGDGTGGADAAADSDGGATEGDGASEDGETTPADESNATEAEPADAETAESETAQPGEIVTEYSGDFSGTSRYDVSGDALVLGNGTEQRFLRFENFDSSNGPDLNVYLFNPNDSSDFIDLGDLKGNIGDQNYEIPADVDLSRYSEVSIWCVRFGVGFGSADLTPAT